MNDERAFLAALAERPDDATLRLVFADWLDEHDDPRSAWLRDPDLFRWSGPTLADPLPNLVRELGKERTRGQVVSALRKLGAVALPSLVQSARNSDPKVRDHALDALEGLGPAAAELLPDFRAWAANASPALRARAAKAIGALGPAAADAVPLLIERLEDPDDGVFVAVTEALGRVGPAAASAIPHFAAAVERAGRIDDATENYGSDSTKTDQPIIEALGNMGPAAIAGLPLLLDALRRYNYDLVGAATKVLEGLGIQVVEPVLQTICSMERETEHYGAGVVMHFGADAVPIILKALKSKKGRDGAVRVINEWHERASAPPPELTAAVPLLAKMLSKASDYEAVTILGAIGGFGADARPAMPALRACAARKGERYGSSVQEAVRLLKALGESVDEVANIRTRLADPNPVTRENAVCQLICQADVPESEKAALYALAFQDAEPPVRTHALRQASWQLREDPAPLVALLRAAATDPAPEVRAEVASVLGDDRANLPDALPLLFPLLADADPNVRAGAVTALSARGASLPSAVDAIRARLTDPDTRVFQAAAQALATLKETGADALTAICSRVRELSDYEQQNVLQALAKVDALPSAAAKPLLDLLAGSNAHLGGHAVLVFRKVKNPPPGAAKVLRKRLKRVDPTEHNADWFAQEIYEALAALGELTPADIPALARSLASENSQTHERAKRLLEPFGTAAVPAARAQLATATGWIRASILIFLARLAPAEVVPDILAELNAADTDGVHTALEMIPHLGPAAGAAAPRILFFLRHEDYYTRTRARTAMGALGAAAVPHVERLVAWWRSDDCPDANEYAELFATLAAHTSAVLPVLREFVRTGDEWRLSKVVEAIGALGPGAAGAVPDLIALAGRATEHRRVLIAPALAQIGVRSPEVIATLRWMAEVEEAPVRDASTAALARLTS